MELSKALMVLVQIFIYFFKLFQRGLLFGASTTIPQAQKDQINESMKSLESFLVGREWIAGDNVTIADLSFLAGLATLVVSFYFLVFGYFASCFYLI